MTTLIIIFFVICIATMYLCSLIDKKRTKSKNNKKTLPTSIIWMITVFIIGGMLVVAYPQAQKANIIKDSEMIIYLKDVEVYHNKNTDEYFALNESNWDCFNLFEKKTIDKNTGEEILEKVNKMVELQNELNDFNDKILKGE